MKVKNDLLMNMNEQHVSLLALLDMRAAFDTVDHRILLERLSSVLLEMLLTGFALIYLRDLSA